MNILFWNLISPLGIRVCALLLEFSAVEKEREPSSAITRVMPGLAVRRVAIERKLCVRRAAPRQLNWMLVVLPPHVHGTAAGPGYHSYHARA